MVLILADKLVSTKLQFAVIVNSSAFVKKVKEVKCHFFSHCLYGCLHVTRFFIFMNGSFIWGWISMCNFKTTVAES